MGGDAVETVGVHLLISPYWNVNKLSQNSKIVVCASFNLSILECKCYCSLVPGQTRWAFNLSILECK